MKSTGADRSEAPPVLKVSTAVAVSPEVCWKAWTTPEGIESFLAPGCRVGRAPGDPYEIYFDPQAAAGERGSEGARIMAVDPGRLFSFSWNFPPSIPALRRQYSLVALHFLPRPSGCELVLIQSGCGTGPVWREGLDYFRRAWGEVVMPRFVRFTEGERVDWKNPSPPESAGKGIETEVTAGF